MSNDNKTNSFDEKKTIMGKSLKFIHKVYISYIKHIDKNETIKIKYSDTSFIIKKDLKQIFNDYEKYKNNKINSGQNIEILEEIKKFFELKSSDLLKFSKKFPFENKDTSVEIDEDIQKIIGIESKNINLENKLGISLDKLKPVKKIIYFKCISDNYNKKLLDNGDDYLYTQLLDKNCYEIINICFFQNQKTIYKELYECSIEEVKINNKSKLLLISNDYQVIQIFNFKFSLYKEKNDENKSSKNKSQNFLNKKNGKDLNSSNNQEDPQNTSKSTLIPNNSQVNQKFNTIFLLCKKKNDDDEFLIKIEKKDLNSSSKKEKEKKNLLLIIITKKILKILLNQL